MRAHRHAPVIEARYFRDHSRKATIMIATVLYILNAIWRALNKTARGLVILAEAFAEAQHYRRSISRKYRHVEE